MTTLQDLGRPGYQHLGVPVSGALDHVSLRAANLLVGNAPGVGALEIAYQGPTLRVEADSVRIAVAGGRAPIDILPSDGGGGAGPGAWRARACCAGGREDRRLAGSAVAYLAVEGGFDIAPVLGSQSTLTRGGDRRVGGPGAARPATSCPCASERRRARGGRAAAARSRRRAACAWSLGRRTTTSRQPACARCWRAPTPSREASDRMGMRLDGPPLEHSAKGDNIVSDGIARLHPGARQRPAHRAAGRPADHRRLPQDRHRHLRRPARAGPHNARRQNRFRGGRHRDGRGRARQLAADIAAMAAQISPVAARRGDRRGG